MKWLVLNVRLRSFKLSLRKDSFQRRLSRIIRHHCSSAEPVASPELVAQRNNQNLNRIAVTKSTKFNFEIQSLNSKHFDNTPPR